MTSGNMTRSTFFRWSLLGVLPLALALALCVTQGRSFGRVGSRGVQEIHSSLKIRAAFRDIRARAERAARKEAGRDVRKMRCVIRMTCGQANLPETYEVEFYHPQPPEGFRLDGGVLVVLSGQDFRVRSVVTRW